MLFQNRTPPLAFQNAARQPSSEREVSKLESRLIESYEQAIDEGLPPSQAVAVILNWVAGECARLRDEGSPTP